ncbi:alpha-L-fucosidase [Zobellia nedashkovskayae]
MFFTQKGQTLYGICPKYPKGNLTVKNVKLKSDAKVTLLGYEGPLKWEQNGKDIIVNVPSLTASEVPCDYAWTFKIDGVKKIMVGFSKNITSKLRIVLLLCLPLFACKDMVAPKGKENPDAVTQQRLPESKLREWQALKYGMFIHFGMSTFLGEELPDGQAPLDTYAPTNLDVSQWVRVAKEAGMTYAVLTAKHVAGHCLWPSDYTDYDVSGNKTAVDVVGEFVKECRKQGIRPGLYYCAWDNHHTFGSLMPGKSENYNGAMVTPTEMEPEKGAPYTSHLYQNFMTAQIDELLERYSPLVEFWIDIPIILGDGYRQFIYDRISKKISRYAYRHEPWKEKGRKGILSF